MKCSSVTPGKLTRYFHPPWIGHDRRGLAFLLAHAVTPASLIPPDPPEPEELERNVKTEARDHAASKGGLLEKDRNILPIVLDEFHAAHSWDEIADLCGGWDHGYFKAIWRGDRTASVKPDRDERYCCDYGTHGTFPKKLDKLGAWCLAQGLDQKVELAKRCEEYRLRCELPACQDGHHVTWKGTPRGGDDFPSPVDGTVVKRNKATVTIQRTWNDGSPKEVQVKSASLCEERGRISPSSGKRQHPGHATLPR